MPQTASDLAPAKASQQVAAEASTVSSSSSATPVSLETSRQQQYITTSHTSKSKTQQQTPQQQRTEAMTEDSEQHQVKDNQRNNQDNASTLATEVAAAADSNAPETDPAKVAAPQPTTTADAAAAAGNQQNPAGPTTIKQFSDKSLQELADYYLNLKPADIPDTGFVVSGIAGRFPNADNLNELWDNLLNGKDMVLGPDDKRWPLGLWDLPKKAARIKDISRFDNEFFGIPKETADYTDH